MKGLTVLRFRGDAHRFYLKLKKRFRNNQHFSQDMNELEDIQQIRNFYSELNSNMLYNVRYRMMKEEKATGIIPLLVYTLPWLVFIFSKQLTRWLFDHGTLFWITFVLLYITVAIISVVLHFREKAWASVHLEIVNDILERRGDLSEK
jgi:hypothetical protein